MKAFTLSSIIVSFLIDVALIVIAAILYKEDFFNSFVVIGVGQGFISIISSSLSILSCRN